MRVTMTPIRWVMLGLVVLIGVLFYCREDEDSYREWVSDYFGLGAVGKEYRDYQDKHGKPPAGIEDLREYEYAHEMLAGGHYEIVWGVPITRQDECDEVLGWSNKTTYKGINVLMQNGTVRAMTADKLAACPKAKRTQ